MKKRFLAVLISALILSTSVLAGCGCENKTATSDEATTTVSETHEVSDTSSTTATEATLSTTDKAIVDAGLKVDDKGNITDKNGKKVEVKDGKVEVKTEDGKIVTVNVTDISTVQTTNSKVNTSTSSKANATSSKTASSKPSGSITSSKPTSSKPSSSSSSGSSSKPVNQSSASKQESSKVEETKHTHTWVDITKQVKVIDKEAYSYEEPVYKNVQREICSESTCGADLTELTQSEVSAHMKSHALKGENAGWHSSTMQVQVGTKTINVPEQYHYETKTTGRKCSSCGKTEYF